MTSRRLAVHPAEAMREGFQAIRDEAGVPRAFPEEVEREAAAAAQRSPAGAQIDLPFVTIDPPGSRDLDQALHIGRRGDGHRVSYAIADVGALVAGRGGPRPATPPPA